MAKRKTQKKATSRRKTKKKVTRRKPKADLSSVSWDALAGELERREAEIAELEARRAELAEELEAVDEELAAAGVGKPARRGRVGRPRKTGGARRGGRRTTRKVVRRPKNTMNLVDALSKTLKGKTLSVSDAATAVKKAGYKTNSANFRTIVNQALISNKKRFKKVARGQYTAK